MHDRISGVFIKTPLVYPIRLNLADFCEQKWHIFSSSILAIAMPTFASSNCTIFHITSYWPIQNLPGIIAAYFISIALGPGHAGAQAEPAALYLTWKNDPTSTIVIDWHIHPHDTRDSTLYYRMAGENKWNKVKAHSNYFPFSDRIIFRKELTDLQPDTRYAFKTGDFNRVYYFTTMPDNIDQEPMVFAVGGDTYDRGHEARQIWMERMNQVVQKYEPRFILWGGDLAYADGRADQTWRWYGWFDAIKKTLIDEEGNVIPIIVTIGNHETNNSVRNLDERFWNTDSTRQALAPYFYQLLAFPGQPGYGVLDFSDYLSIIALDTDHTNPIDGKQAKWLKKALRKRKGDQHVFPAYHVPAYPSVKPFNQQTSRRIRQFWTPLFDRFHVPMAFEFHDHVYKRTPLIKNNKPDSDGTLYLGDGGWGTQLKSPKSADTVWYLDKIVRERNAYLVSLHKSNRYIRAVNEFGQVIDEYPKLFPDPSFTYPVSTLISTGGSTFSAELAIRSGKTFVDSDFSGYTGKGFAWWDNGQDTACLTWTVPVNTTNDFTLRFRYSYPGPQNGQLQVLVNDQIIEDLFLFSPTGKENKWDKSTLINTYLRKGVNTIELRSIDGDLAPRIDRLEVFPAVH